MQVVTMFQLVLDVLVNSHGYRLKQYFNSIYINYFFNFKQLKMLNITGQGTGMHM